MFFTVPRLPVPRQRNVGNALAELFKTNPSYTPEVTKGAQAVIAATPALSAGEMSMFTIDVATDSVLAALHRTLQDIQRGYVNNVIPLSPEQKAELDAAVFLEETWFPAGIGFIRQSVGLQHAAMTEIRKSLVDKDEGPAVQAAITTLGLGHRVEHFTAHAALYARKLGLAGEVVTDPNQAEPDPSDAWHALYVKFAIDTSSAYRTDPATVETLLGSYERQVEEHRNDLAKERKRAVKKAKEEEQAAAEAKAKAEAAAKATGSGKP
jgi:hypothetical protein